MTPIGRVRLLVAINVSITVVVPLIGLGSGHGVNDLLETWAFVLVYTNVTAIPALIAGPSMVELLARRRWPPPGPRGAQSGAGPADDAPR